MVTAIESDWLMWLMCRHTHKYNLLKYICMYIEWQIYYKVHSIGINSLVRRRNNTATCTHTYIWTYMKLSTYFWFFYTEIFAATPATGCMTDLLQCRLVACLRCCCCCWHCNVLWRGGGAKCKGCRFLLCSIFLCTFRRMQ